MKHSLGLVGVYGLFLACGAAAPTSQPAVTETLADGSIEFVRPGDWVEAKKNRTPLRAAWVSKDKMGLVLVEVWPDGELSDTTGPKTVRKLRADRQKQPGVQIVMPPAVEKDPRFDLRIHEKYQYKANRTVDDVLRLYRRVGKRVVAVTVWSKAPDDSRDKEIHAAGEAAMLSAKAVKK